MPVGLYVVVVADVELGLIDTYGPMAHPAARRMVRDLRDLLALDRVEQVSLSVCRMHTPGGGRHPDDP